MRPAAKTILTTPTAAATTRQGPAETKTVATDPLPLRQVCARVTKGRPRNPRWVRRQPIRHHRRRPPLPHLLPRRPPTADRPEATEEVVESSSLWPLHPHSRWANRVRSPCSRRLSRSTSSRDISSSPGTTTLSRPFSRRLSTAV
jgi:hypothetical protein